MAFLPGIQLVNPGCTHGGLVPSWTYSVIRLDFSAASMGGLCGSIMLDGTHACTHRSLALHYLLHWEGDSRASDHWEILVHQTSSGLAAVKTRDLQF